MTDEGGAILHAELRWQHGAARVTSLASDEDGSLAAMLGASWVWAVVDDADVHHDRAAAAGARIVRPPTEVVAGTRPTGRSISRVTAGRSARIGLRPVREPRSDRYAGARG